MLRRILLRNGLVIDRDYEFLPVGNTGMRTAVIIEGRAVGAMLGNASEEAIAAGVHSLASGNDYAPDYAGNLFVTTRRWAADNPHLMLAFIRAILNTQAWLGDPGNADEAVASIVRTDHVDSDRAQRSYQRALQELGGTSLAEQVQLDAL